MLLHVRLCRRTYLNQSLSLSEHTGGQQAQSLVLHYHYQMSTLKIRKSGDGFWFLVYIPQRKQHDDKQNMYR